VAPKAKRPKAKRKPKPEPDFYARLAAYRKEHPDPPLTQEERRNLEALAREDELWRQRHKERVKWLGIDPAAAGRELDRAAALEKFGPPPSAPAPSPPPPPKKTKKIVAIGRPHVHNYSIIRRIAREGAKTKPVSVKAFFRAVRDQCESEGKPLPGDTLLKKLARPAYKRPKSR
jgi:hypothetical protein